MSRLEVRPFSEEFVDAAGEPLAARRRALRATEPLLPPRYEDGAAATGEVMVVGRRVTSLLASRFWPAPGFRTTFLRLYRP